MIVAPFHPAHLIELRTQAQQPKDLALFSDPDYGQSLASGDSFSIFDSAGELQACLGVFELWRGRGLAWALLSANVHRLMLPISYRARSFFQGSKYDRIEAYIDPNFPQAIRWIELLGFVRETAEPMRKFTPTGADQYLYARIR